MVYVMHILTEVMGSLVVLQVSLSETDSCEHEDQGSVVG